MKILLTGASGFIGSALLKQIDPKYFKVITVLRQNKQNLHYNDTLYIDGINSSTDWTDKLSGIDIIIHCAACTQDRDDKIVEKENQIKEINTLGTLNLAENAAASGVKRFVFISTIKVLGEKTELGKPFKPSDSAKPVEEYGKSKYEAELGLHKIAAKSGMEIIIIRPPLVYGPGVKANFAAMMKLSTIGFPLPFGGFTINRRSMVSVDNLVDLIIICLNHPKAANETFLVSDNDDLSTAETFQRLGIACGKSGILIPFPVTIFEVIFKLIGKTDFHQKLSGSLQVDISETCDKLNWYPPYSVDECFSKTAKHFLENN